jgi:hypothetical protein
MLFDIVIPFGPNEKYLIHEQIKYTKENVIGYNNIYIITYDSTIQVDGCIMIDENIFEFKEFIINYFKQYHGKQNRNMWYYQQLLKLYAGYKIPSILDNYLVIDADVFFLKKTSFFENNKPIFTTSEEYHNPYFIHMNRLNSQFEKVYEKSGICHHMMFNKTYLNEIMQIVENTHNIEFWKAFILLVIEHCNYNIHYLESGASEYELYFNYMIKNYNDKIIIRDLKWQNCSSKEFNNIQHYIVNDYDYISICHHF